MVFEKSPVRQQNKTHAGDCTIVRPWARLFAPIRQTTHSFRSATVGLVPSPMHIAEQKFEDLLDSLADKSPAPGGGAVAAMLGATASSLAGMVVAYSIGKKSLAPHQQMLEAAAERLTSASAQFLTLAAQDAEAYAQLNALQKRPTDDPVRISDEPPALRRAIEAPDAARILAMEVLELVASLVGRTNKYLRSDLAIAAVAAESAAVSAGWNVLINAPGLPEPERETYLKTVLECNTKAGNLRRRIEDACAQDECAILEP